MNLVHTHVSLGSISHVHSGMLGLNAGLGLSPRTFLNLPVVNPSWVERLCLSQPLWLKKEKNGNYCCIGGVQLLGWLRQHVNAGTSVPALIVQGAAGPKFIEQQYLLEQLLVPALSRTSPDRVRVLHHSRDCFHEWPLPADIRWSALASAHGFYSREGSR